MQSYRKIRTKSIGNILFKQNKFMDINEQGTYLHYSTDCCIDEEDNMVLQWNFVKDIQMYGIQNESELKFTDNIVALWKIKKKS